MGWSWRRTLQTHTLAQTNASRAASQPWSPHRPLRVHSREQRPHLPPFSHCAVHPAFPFGFGLSYASFTYSNLRVDGRAVSFSVTRSGTNGCDTPQLYVSYPTAATDPTVPVKVGHGVAPSFGNHPLHHTNNCQHYDCKREHVVPHTHTMPGTVLSQSSAFTVASSKSSTSTHARCGIPCARRCCAILRRRARLLTTSSTRCRSATSPRTPPDGSSPGATE